MNNTFLRYFVILIWLFVRKKFKHYYCKCIFIFLKFGVDLLPQILAVEASIVLIKIDKAYISLAYHFNTVQTDISAQGSWHLGPDRSAQIYWHVRPCKRHLSPMKLSVLIMLLGQGVIGLTCPTFFNMQKIPF